MSARSGARQAGVAVLTMASVVIVGASVALASPQGVAGAGTSTCMAYRGGRWVAETCAPPPPMPLLPAGGAEVPAAPTVSVRAIYRHARERILGLLADGLQDARGRTGVDPDVAAIAVPAFEHIQEHLPATTVSTENAAEALDAISLLHAHLHGWRTAYYVQAQRRPHLQAQEAAVRRDTAEARAYFDDQAREIGRWEEERERLMTRVREVNERSKALSQLSEDLEAALRPVAVRVIERVGGQVADTVFRGLSPDERRDLGLADAVAAPTMPVLAPLRSFPLIMDDPSRSGVVAIPSPPRVPPVAPDLDRRALDAGLVESAANQTVALAREVSRAVVDHVETVRAMERATEACGEYNGLVADGSALTVKRDAARRALAEAAQEAADAESWHALLRFDAFAELARNGLWAYFDAETMDLARLVRIDPEAARSFATVQQRVLRFADEGLAYLPEVVRDLGSLSAGQQSRLDASMSATVCRFARDIEREAAPAFLQPLFERVTCR